MPLPADNPTNDQNPIKVFISYSHDSESHRENVRLFAEKLMSHGVKVIFDQWVNGSPEQGWSLWMLDALDDADFVLVVCTTGYYQKARKQTPAGEGNGVKWEAMLHADILYQNGGLNNKVIPLFMDMMDSMNNTDVKLIPEWLRGFSHYCVNDNQGYLDLYRHITNQPKYREPELGQPLDLPPHLSSDKNIILVKPKVNLSAMPTSSGIIVGRESEVDWLNKAWVAPKSRVVSVIAWGGVGKSSLINHWLNDMGDNDFNGAAQVFAHSFYSQGTSDQRNVSAEHFMDDAFKFLSFSGDMPESAHDKGLLLAELFCQQRTLLVLDGLEPMQHPPGVLKGKLKDSALEVFIKQLAFNLNGLCVITSRVPVYELANRGEQFELKSLSVEAGIKVLTNFGVTGPKQDMINAVNEVHGHALTLSLTGSFIQVARDGDIRKRDTVSGNVNKTEPAIHANKVMCSYTTWLQNHCVVELALLCLIGLFDRPVALQTINELLQPPLIDGLTNALVKIEPRSFWQKLTFKKATYKVITADEITQALARLYQLQLIAQPSETLDCHPLVREHFANTLKTQNPQGYQQAHQRLYEYYKNLPDDELPNTLEQMQPLFNAISHGCKAGLYQQALDEVYWPRIHRKGEAFIVKKLGLFATNLACIANFFTDDGWAQPASELSEEAQALMLNWAAFALRGLGRLHEALAPFIASIDFVVKQQNWKGAASAASSASELCLTLGQVDKAIEYGKLSVEYADKIEKGQGQGKGKDDEFWQMASRTVYADALLQRGLPADITQAQTLFIDAEKRQQAWQPNYPYLYSLQGYRYCQLLLKQALTAQSVNEVIERVETTLGWVTKVNWLLDIALDQLTLGKAYWRNNDLTQAQHYLDQAVSGLRKSGYLYYLPWGLLTRANYYTQCNTKHNLPNHQAAWRDLDEAFEIASFGDMRLHLCDYHIEACRNIAAQLVGNGEAYIVIENGQTIHPDKAQMVERMNEHFETAKTMIDELPYHWRDDDLKALQNASMP